MSYYTSGQTTSLNYHKTKIQFSSIFASCKTIKTELQESCTGVPNCAYYNFRTWHKPDLVWNCTAYKAVRKDRADGFGGIIIITKQDLAIKEIPLPVGIVAER